MQNSWPQNRNINKQNGLINVSIVFHPLYRICTLNSPSIVVCQYQVTTDLIQLNATNKHIERIKKINFIFMYAKHETLKTKCSLLVMKITAMNKRKIDKMERCFACVPNNKFQSNCIQLYIQFQLVHVWLSFKTICRNKILFQDKK